MKLLKNQGSEQVIDELCPSLSGGGNLDATSPDLSLFASDELRVALHHLGACRLIIPDAKSSAPALLGSNADRGFRNQLTTRNLAWDLSEWLRRCVEVKAAPALLPQTTLVTKNTDGIPAKVISENCPLSTDGLGIMPGNQFSLVQVTETPAETELLAAWFTQLWTNLPTMAQAKETLLAQLGELTARREPFLIYVLTISHLFKNRDDAFDEDKIVKSATGIRNTVVWKKLFKFQRDGVVGAIDKLERLDGGVLLVCLNESIAREDVEPLAMGIIAWHKEQAPAGESTVVFRDSAFADDVAKTNLTAILQHLGLENVRSL